MTIGPTLTTERLILRPPSREDLPGFIELMATDHSRFIGGPQPPEVVWRSLSTLAGAWVIEGFSMFSFIERDTGRWIGRGGPWAPMGWPAPEVGWGLLPQAQGKGYATEAATAAIDWVFDTLGWKDVIHCIAADNAPSKAVAGRLGSAYRGPGKLPPPLDAEIEIWGQNREAWRARR